MRRTAITLLTLLFATLEFTYGQEAGGTNCADFCDLKESSGKHSIDLGPVRIRGASFSGADGGSTPKISAPTSSFALGFSGRQRARGTAGSAVTQSYNATMRHSGTGPGAIGYSIGMTATNASIVGVDIAGTDAESLLHPDPLLHFKHWELTSGPGNEGAIVVAVFELGGGITMLPKNAKSTIGRMDVQATIPAGGGTASLQYRDSLRGRGEPVACIVTNDEAETARDVTKTAKTIELVELGTVFVGPSSHPNVGNCGPNSAPGEVFIPNSEEGVVAEFAAIEFLEGACADGDPTKVEVTLFAGAHDVTLRAIDGVGHVVDSATVGPGGPHVIGLRNPGGIARVDIVGAEISILGVCWTCEEGNCESIGERFNAPTMTPHEFRIDRIVIEGPLLPSGDPVEMATFDADGDGDQDLSIPWSDTGAAHFATIHMDDACDDGSRPTSVSVKIMTDHAVIRALDAVGNLLDTAAATAPYRVQILTVEAAAGIARVEIQGSQMALVSVCWSCGSGTGGEGKEKFMRSDANSDGRSDVSDALRILNYLFSGGVEIACLDSADVNDTGVIDISDGVAVLGYLFSGQDAPAAPGPSVCGADPTPDNLPCEKFSVCP